MRGELNLDMPFILIQSMMKRIPSLIIFGTSEPWYLRLDAYITFFYKRRFSY